MSDPVALVCAGGSSSNDGSSRRWRRRAPTTHSVRVGVLHASPSPRERPRLPVLRRAAALLLVGGAAWASVTAALAHTGGSVFSRRIGAGCEELEPCLSLEAEAERRLDACVLFCAGAAAELTAARQMRFRAEERRAVREHYRQRDRAERSEREQERDERREQWQREQAARAAEASREQRHRLELESLRQERIDRRIAEERQRRVAYLAALGPAGRALRLERCLKKHERCDALALDLLEAARDDAERRKLAEANEGLVHPPPKPDVPRAASTAVAAERPRVGPPALAPASDATAIPSS